jgi:hypothetical protein
MADQVNGIGTQKAIDELSNQNNQYIEQQQKLNDQIVDAGIKKQQLEVDQQKQQLQEDATKQSNALYTNYQKQVDPYGVQAEAMASQGLSNSGYAESSRVSLYNNYQSNVTSLVNEMNRAKSELDLQMNQALLDADVQKAQNAVNTLMQKMEMTMNTYQLRYSLYRDQIADERWQKEYELSQAQMAFNQQQADRDYEISLAQLQRS